MHLQFTAVWNMPLHRLLLCTSAPRREGTLLITQFNRFISNQKKTPQTNPNVSLGLSLITLAAYHEHWMCIVGSNRDCESFSRYKNRNRNKMLSNVHQRCLFNELTWVNWRVTLQFHTNYAADETAINQERF